MFAEIACPHSVPPHSVLMITESENGGSGEAPSHSLSVDGDYEVGTVLWLSCPPGYTLVGQAMLSCTSTGEWSDSLPDCEKTEKCREAPPSVNGSIYSIANVSSFGLLNIAFISTFWDKNQWPFVIIPQS